MPFLEKVEISITPTHADLQTCVGTPQNTKILMSLQKCKHKRDPNFAHFKVLYDAVFLPISVHFDATFCYS